MSKSNNHQNNDYDPSGVDPMDDEYDEDDNHPYSLSDFFRMLNEKEQELDSISFKIDDQYVFTSISVDSPNLTFAVTYHGKDKKSLLEFYSDILESDSMDFKISIAIPFAIESKMGYLDINEVDKKLRIIVEYTVMSDRSVINSKTFVDNQPHSVFNHMRPVNINGLGELSVSSNLVRLEPVDSDAKKNLLNTTWLYCANINMIDLNNVNYNNHGLLDFLYKCTVDATEEIISNLTTHRGVTNIKYKKIYNSTPTATGIQIDVYYIPIGFNDFETGLISKNKVILKDNDVESDDVVSNISSMIVDCFSDSDTIIVPESITRQSAFLGENYQKFSQYDIRNTMYSIKNKEAKYYYSDLVYNSNELCIYKRKSLNKKKCFFGLMTDKLYRNLEESCKTGDQSAFDKIVENVKGTQNHTNISILKKAGNSIYFTLE